MDVQPPRESLSYPPMNEFIKHLRELTVNPLVEPKFSPLEKVADTIRSLSTPDNSKLVAPSVGVILVPEAIMRLWKEFGSFWLNVYFDKFEKYYPPSPEAAQGLSNSMKAIESQCVETVAKLPKAHIDIPLAEIAVRVDDATTAVLNLQQLFTSSQEFLKSLTPEQVMEVCKNFARGSYPELIRTHIIPEIYTKVLKDLNTGFEAIRTAGIFMLAYAVFKDKLTEKLLSSQAGILEKTVVDIVGNLTIAYSALYVNSLLTFIHTGGYFTESMMVNMDTAAICALVMSATRLVAEWKVDKPENRQILEFMAGASTLVAIAGINSLTVLKFILGFVS